MFNRSVFVISASGVVSTKLDTAEVRFNKRVVECRLAAALLGNYLGYTGVVTLRDVADKYLADGHERDRDSIIPTSVLFKAFHEEPYTLQEVADLLKQPIESVRDRCVIRRIRGDDFKLRQRTLHVYTEAQRVYKYVDVCQNSAGDARTAQLAKLGALMNESQASCRDQYECSCAELDQLCDIAREAGAVGARLTGAGWGGCTIALCDSMETATKVHQALQAKYFASRASQNLPCFVTTPCQGASFLSCTQS